MGLDVENVNMFLHHFRIRILIFLRRHYKKSKSFIVRRIRYCWGQKAPKSHRKIEECLQLYEIKKFR